MENRELTKSRIPRLSQFSSPTSPRSQALPKAQTSIPSPRYRVTSNLTHKCSPKQTFNATKNDKTIVKTTVVTQPLVEKNIESEVPFEAPPDEHLMNTESNEHDEISHVGNPISQKDIDDALKGMIFPSEQDHKLKNVFTIIDSPAAQLSDDDCVLFEKEVENIQTPSDHGDTQGTLAKCSNDCDAGTPATFLTKKESALLKTSCGSATKLRSHPILEEIRNVTPPPLQQSQEDLIASLLTKNVQMELVQEEVEEVTHFPNPQLTIKPEEISIKKQGNSKSCPLHETSSNKSIGYESRCKSASTTQSPAERLVVPISEPVEDLRKSEDLNVLFTATPIKMNSTQSVVHRELKKPTEPTYLQLHQEKLQKMQAEMAESIKKETAEPSWHGATLLCTADESTDEIEEVGYDRVEEQTQTSFPSLDYGNRRSLQVIAGQNAQSEERKFGSGFDVRTSPEYMDLLESDFDFEDEGDDIGVTIESDSEEEKLMEYLLRANPDTPSKKQKTIYSLDVSRRSSLNFSAKEAVGPGNNGDGYDIRPQKSATRKAELDQDVEELYKRGNIQNENVAARSGPSTGFIPNEPAKPTKLMSRMTSKGHIEIVSSFNEPSNDDFCGIAPAESKKSAFIMQRNSKSCDVFQSSQTISNLTSEVCAYKVYMNKSAANHYSVTRKHGFIYPNRDVVFDVKTRESARITSQLAIQDEIVVKIFPAYCDKETELAEYYAELSQQRPDLIQTHSIDKIILWDAGDLVKMKNLLDSIKDEDERFSLKEQLHREYSRRVIPEVSSKRLLNKVQSEMQMANASLRAVFNQLVLVRNSTYTLMYGLVFLFVVLMILPLLHTTAVIVEVPEAEESVYEKIISFFKTIGL
ncbi:hypothetical protein Ocin01_10467 [Orchesella cincta]|uniref:Uncharacterized protein n=1 Tax=Orchesella cincta TaxID=48709 RepID=A0A1D2MU41_ORCCI|nr:hypothetical protein Ocin01_10467 [Orchesella cincta]